MSASKLFGQAYLSRRDWIRLTAASLASTSSMSTMCARAAVPKPSTALALLVGNTAYDPNEEDLPPAQKCLIDLQDRLKRLGFTTTLLHDAPVEQVLAELDRLQAAVTEFPETAVVFYFIGHGFQSDGENMLVPAGNDLEADPRALARRCLSVDRHVFPRLARPAGRAATVILLDACRTPDRPRSPNEGYNQTMPPNGCHVAFATGPGQRAFAPADPRERTLFAEALVVELEDSKPSRSVLHTLEGVRVRVARKVNSMPSILQAFGRNAQEPELASNVRGDPTWIVVVDDIPAKGSEVAAEATHAVPSLPSAPDDVPAQQATGLRGAGDDDQTAAIAAARQRALQRAEKAARQADLTDDARRAAAQVSERVAEDADRALHGDKYAALRVAQALPQPVSGELIERTDYGRWMAFAAYLGNGIAAYRLSLYFRNVDRRDAEALHYLQLARENHYTPPRQLPSSR